MVLSCFVEYIQMVLIKALSQSMSSKRSGHYAEGEKGSSNCDPFAHCVCRLVLLSDLELAQANATANID